MLKYANSMVVFEEIPDEITLAINITNCPCHCKGCHSQYLWEDIGTVLDNDELDRLIAYNQGITCVCFMGGDISPVDVNSLAEHVRKGYPELLIGWYSGMDELSREINLDNFDLIKIGRYDENLGGLDKKSTNQRFYVVMEGEIYDRTDLFWRPKSYL